MSASFQNILVINVNWLGDVVLSAPVFLNLKKKYPAARLTCLAVPRVKEVLECVPHVDEIIIYDEDGQHASIFGKWQLIQQLKKKKFDIVFILHKSLTRALIAYLANIPTRVGYNTKKRQFLLTHSYDAPRTPTHRLEEYAGLVKSFGIPLEDLNVLLRLDEKDLSKAQDRLNGLGIQNHDFSVVIHPAANWNLKRWPKHNFSRLIEKLMGQGAKVIVTGGKEEKDLVDDITKDMKLKPHVLVGQTSIKELAAIMKKVSVVVSADSGPMHLASGMSANVVALFGPTRVEITGPRGKGRVHCLQHEVGCNSAPCYHLSCPDNICMQAISVDEVYDAIKQIRS